MATKIIKKFIQNIIKEERLRRITAVTPIHKNDVVKWEEYANKIASHLSLLCPFECYKSKTNTKGYANNPNQVTKSCDIVPTGAPAAFKICTVHNYSVKIWGELTKHRYYSFDEILNANSVNELPLELQERIWDVCATDRVDLKDDFINSIHVDLD